MVVEVPSDLKVVALFAITLLVWWHFPPPLFHFDGTFRHHDFFHSDLSGGAFCPHFCILTALFASILFRLCTSQQKVDTTLYFYTSFNEHNTPYTVLESDNSESMPDVLH